jgi:hypothetical protein
MLKLQEEEPLKLDPRAPKIVSLLQTYFTGIIGSKLVEASGEKIYNFDPNGKFRIVRIFTTLLL